MPRYYFDIHDGVLNRDPKGLECADFKAVRAEAMHTLPQIALFEIPNDGDYQAFTVMVRDEGGKIVYTATMTFTGLRMDDRDSMEAPLV